MAAKITTRPTNEGISIFQGLKVETAGGWYGALSYGNGADGGFGMGVVKRFRTIVSSSSSSCNNSPDPVGTTTRSIFGWTAPLVPIPAAINKSSTNSAADA